MTSLQQERKTITEVTKDTAYNLSIRQDVHSTDIRKYDLIPLGVTPPPVLAGYSDNVVIGQHLHGSCWLIEFTTHLHVDHRQKLRCGDNEYLIDEVNVHNRGPVIVSEVKASHEAAEPRGFRFIDKKIADWFFKKS